MKRSPDNDQPPRDVRRLLDTTSANQKVHAYIERLIEDTDFLSRARKIRRALGIPEDGEPNVLYQKTSSGDYFVTYPDYIQTNAGKLTAETDKLAADYGLDFMWAQMIQHFIVYADLNVFVGASVIETHDVYHELHGSFEYEGEKEAMQEYLIDRVKDTPVAIYISAYVSQRDLIDYIKKAYKPIIEPLLEDHRNPEIKIGKKRRKNPRVKERDEFIYEHRELPAKEIMQEVARHFDEYLDYSYISKIIKREKERRQ